LEDRIFHAATSVEMALKEMSSCFGSLAGIGS
jgi:hypothetical protein